MAFVWGRGLGDGTDAGGSFKTTENGEKCYAIDYHGVTPMGGGGLVDAGCCALEAVLVAAPSQVWSSHWARRGASFWLTRLSRDRVAQRRARAWRLLAHAASPGARQTRAMLQKAWPESVTAAANTALDSTEAPAPRAAAASFIAACLSSAIVADEDMEAELLWDETNDGDADESFVSSATDKLGVSVLDVVPLLNQKW